jgi:two-component system LytT family sensor kinase
MMQIYFPKMDIGQISFIVTAIPKGRLTIGLIMAGAFNYYFFLLIWVCIFTMAWYLRDYSRQTRLVEETRKKQIETELSFLKNQINPHFLFNTLNNLYSLALKKADTAPDAILQLSAILRYLLYESDSKEVSFEKEKEIMNAYIGLELLRLTDKENLHFSISADNNYNIPPLLWLPVLENVFKHGTRYISVNRYIGYKFTIENNKLTMHSKNEFKLTNGVESEQKSQGIGLDNLRKRLELLFKDKYTIHTKVEGSYYIADIIISL